MRSTLPVVLLAAVLAGCTETNKAPEAPADAGATQPATNVDPVQAKIEQAMQAGPAALTASAAIMDWPSADGKMAELRPGTNGWVCMPSSPTPADKPADGENAMCLDKGFQLWADAWTGKKPVPKFEGVAFSYMLLGDRGASNVDPYATEATPDNQWVNEGKHIMLVTSDPSIWNTLPTDPKNGGPYVMWKGTPYAHVMVPLGN